jgi:glycosyltransferase involved in cell wall biosynthesis
MRRYDYGVKAVWHALGWGADLIYTRLPQSAAIGSRMGITSIYELHDMPQGRRASWLLNSFLKGCGAQVLVLITDALRVAVNARFDLPASLPQIVAADGVDLVRYQDLPSQAEARELLSSMVEIPRSTLVAGYTGHLYPGRGAGLILAIAERVPEVHFLLVGGEEADLERLQQTIQSRGLENVSLHGFVSNTELPRYQAACDMLLMPYQRKISASSGGDIAKYLSPMKLFEYMACGRVILSSDLAVLREVLKTENAVLLPPDDPDAWANAIHDLRGDPEKCARLAKKAQVDVQQYSWENRTQKILSKIEA